MFLTFWLIGYFVLHVNHEPEGLGRDNYLLVQLLAGLAEGDDLIVAFVMVTLYLQHVSPTPQSWSSKSLTTLTICSISLKVHGRISQILFQKYIPICSVR